MAEDAKAGRPPDYDSLTQQYQHQHQHALHRRSASEGGGLSGDRGEAAAEVETMSHPRRSFVRRLPPIDAEVAKAQLLARSKLSHDEVVQRELAVNTVFTNPHPESLIPTPKTSPDQGGRRRSHKPAFRDDGGGSGVDDDDGGDDDDDDAADEGNTGRGRSHGGGSGGGGGDGQGNDYGRQGRRRHQGIDSDDDEDDEDDDATVVALSPDGSRVGSPSWSSASSSAAVSPGASFAACSSEAQLSGT